MFIDLVWQGHPSAFAPESGDCFRATNVWLVCTGGVGGWGGWFQKELEGGNQKLESLHLRLGRNLIAEEI